MRKDERMGRAKTLRTGKVKVDNVHCRHYDHFLIDKKRLISRQKLKIIYTNMHRLVSC